MKYLLTLILIFIISLNSSAQVHLRVGVGKEINSGAVGELSVSENIDHSVISLDGDALFRDSEPAMAALTYGYEIGHFKPFAGYGYHKWTSDHADAKNGFFAHYGLQYDHNKWYLRGTRAGVYTFFTGGLNF